MKLRLAIDVAPGNSIAFEHGGPVIRIGRDPECELVLQGEASTAVSRHHARIDLNSEGATLTDTGSSNGTLLNGRLTEGTTPLHAGDRIQMGYTGATLTVRELDLGAPAPAGRTLTGAVIVGLSAAVVVALIVAAVLIVRKPGAPEERGEDPGPGTTSTSSAPGRTTNPAPIIPPATPKTPPPTTRKDPPPQRITEVASYEPSEKEASVLLQREDAAHPWVVLFPGARVAADAVLVGLPGYRGFLKLDRGLLLTLWGNLAEFASSAATPESAVMLHAPPPNVDLDFTLDRGRVVLTNGKADGKPAVVHLHFLQEKWELTLADPHAEVGVEIWAVPGELAPDLTQRGGATHIALFTRKGPVEVRTPHKNLSLGDQECADWASDQPADFNPQSLREFEKDVPNSWWTKVPDRNAPAVQNKLRSLLDWCDRLGGVNVKAARRDRPAGAQGPVIETILTTVTEEKDPDTQDLGVLFLAALDDAGSLLEPLHDVRHASVRATALLALQTWLSRGGHHAADLVDKLQERKRYSKETAQRIVRLMYPLSKEALRQRQTYVELVNSLDHDALPIRDLGLWHLGRLWDLGLLPKEAKIDYDPTQERAKRKAAVDQLQKLIAEGKIPVAGRRP